MKRGNAGYGFDWREGKLAFISLETIRLQGIEKPYWAEKSLCGGSTHSEWVHLGHGFYWCEKGFK